MSSDPDELTTPAPVLPLDPPSLGSSFSSLLDRRGLTPRWVVPVSGELIDVADGTTVLAVKFDGGVVMAGDRRAVAGNLIAHKRVQKVFPADDYSVVASSGTAGMAIELIRLFQTELEHYEKIEGLRLSLEGKANYLARMVRNQLPLAFQGLVVVPLFAGYDAEERDGKLYTFDVVGGRYEEQDYAATGSGGQEAKAFLKNVFRPDLTEEEALRIAVEALIAAAEEDVATGGPDLKRGILPNVVTVTDAGLVEIPDERLTPIAAEIMERRP